eukprot:TRINITY_DN37060_c0_g1_i1.p2 TRINITY_DN37060_c0_g1~~TRINITY_DN37060_c0_g1_i1.p2  ORF type:complete len:315 (+),score=63.88 TRINITY_DN37060_c0_g1_i1:77-946(+)
MAPMRDGDWICSSCQNHNFASRQNCNKCAAPKEDSEGGYGARRSKGPAPSKRASPYEQGGSRASAASSAASDGGEREMKEGDWVCPQCENHNFASRVNCNRCGTLREGMKQGDWICKGCKNHNFAKRSTCNKCGSHRQDGDRGRPSGRGPVGTFGSPSASPMHMAMGYAPMHMQQMMPHPFMPGPAFAGKGFPGKGMMPVPTASPRVYAAYNHMPMAAAPQPVKNMKEGDWLCQMCGNHNFASRVECNKCKAVRPGMKRGDWVCRECKHHNFSKNTECKKCAAPRPDAA